MAAGASDGLATDFGMHRVVMFRDPDGFEAEIALWTEGTPLRYEDAIREPQRRLQSKCGLSTTQPKWGRLINALDGGYRPIGRGGAQAVGACGDHCN